MKIDVCFTPQEYLRHSTDCDHAVAVLDILRATTSITAAFVNGCRRIVPVETVGEARTLKQADPSALLAGERHAMPIPGFDLGNSPFDFAGPKVNGRTIIMTTTNGTVALRTADQAALVCVGAFVNAAAVARRLAASKLDVVILCAGTQGRFSLEDALCAGLLVGRLTREGDDLSDAAIAAAALYQHCRDDIARHLGRCAHARYLESIGFAGDITYSLKHDLHDIVPQYIGGAVIDPATASG